MYHEGLWWIFEPRLDVTDTLIESAEVTKSTNGRLEIAGRWSVNKPAAQTAGTDPFRCNFTNRKNPPIQQNRCYF